MQSYGGLVEQPMVSYLFVEPFYLSDLEPKIFIKLIISDQVNKLLLSTHRLDIQHNIDLILVSSSLYQDTNIDGSSS